MDCANFSQPFTSPVQVLHAKQLADENPKESRQSLGLGTIFFPTEDLRKNMNQNTKKTIKEMLQSHEALLQEGSGASLG